VSSLSKESKHEAGVKRMRRARLATNARALKARLAAKKKAKRRRWP
jgi:hypothetical protein